MAYHHYNLCGDYGHATPDVNHVYQICEDIPQQGIKIIRETGPMNAGIITIALVEDPDIQASAHNVDRIIK